MIKAVEQSRGRKKLSDVEREARKAVLKSEAKDVKFRRVVQPRVRKAVKSIKNIICCFGSGYTYTEAEATVIVEALLKAIQLVEAASQKKQGPEDSFKL